jgi:PspC domain
VLYRVGFVVLALLGGAGILIYAVAALVIPDDGRDESIVEAAVRERRDRPWRLVGLALVTISAIVLLSEARVWDGHLAWVLVLISGIVLLSFGPRLWREATATPGPDTPDGAVPPPSAPQRSFAIATAVLGALVVAAGVLGVLAAAGVDVPWAFALAVAAGAVGVAVVIGAVLHLRVGWLVFVGLVLGAAAILASTIDLKLEDGMGDRTYAPLSATGLRDEYRLGVGNLDLDLGGVRLPPGETEVKATLGVGHLVVTVPRGVALDVTSHVDWGESVLLGHDENGHDVDDTLTSPAGTDLPKLVLDADVGIGQVEVVRAVR